MKLTTFAGALVITALAATSAGCGGKPSPRPSQPAQRQYSTPYGPAAHSPTFGLPPKGVVLPFRLAPTVTPTLEMYDTVTISTVPGHARVVAGYTAGFWPTFASLVKAFPRALHVSIAIASHYGARCLDIEPGDAVPSQATGWYRLVHSEGVVRPCFYTSLSEMPAVRANLSSHGIGRSQVLLWDANWTYKAHLDAGYDATQWTDHALGRNLDESTVTTAFAGVKPAPKPKPHPRPKPNPRLVKLYHYRSYLRHVLLAQGCRVKRPSSHCRGVLKTGQRVNREIRALGGR
jgi:hypothetical protein